MEEGEKHFKNISENFERNIAEAKTEFEINSAIHAGSASTKIKALSDMYLLCISAANSIRENILFKEKNVYRIPEKDPQDKDYLEYLHAYYRKYYKIPNSKEIEYLKTLNSQAYKEYVDLHDSYELYVSYIAKAIEARDTIISDFSDIFGNSALKDILLHDKSSEDFFLDEYQIVLIQANTLVQYWERKTYITEIVTQLSIDYENGLIKEDDIYKAWKEAKIAYEESIILYDNELVKLNNISGDISAQQQILNNISQTIKIEEDKLAKLNSQYSALLMAKTVGQNEYLHNDLKNKYDILVSEYEKLFKTGDMASYKNLLDYGMKYSLAEQSEAAKNVLYLLINGNNADVLSLSELKKNTQDNNIDIKLRLAAIDMFADRDTNQLRGQDSTYNSADWYFKAKENINVDFNSEYLFGENLGIQLESDLYKVVKKLYEERLNLELTAFQEYLIKISDTYEYEKVEQIYAALIYLQELINNDDLSKIDYENEIISYFISGGIFFISENEGNLPGLYNEYRYCSGLLEIYNNYAAINSFTSKETWQQSISKLNQLFDDNGIYFNNNYLPAAELICNVIIKKPGNLLHNTFAFLFEFNNCFSLLPNLFYSEIFYWEQSVLKYIAAYAFLNNIDISQISSNQEEENINNNIIFMIESLNTEYSSNEKYWRQFLSPVYINEYNYAIDFKPDLSSGLLTDILEIADYHTNRLRDLFTLYSNSNINFSSGNIDMFYYLYSNEVIKTNQDLYYFNSLKNEISRIGAAYDYMNLSEIETNIELKNSLVLVKKQEDIFNNLHDMYISAATAFEEYGKAYNKQYSLVKSIYDESNKNRYKYELQDTIIRCISTIYMDFDLFDLEFCREKLNRAELVLKVLTDLYASEDVRSYQNKKYNELYSAYEKSFSIKTLTMEAFQAINYEIVRSNENYNSAYKNYISNLYNLGNVNQEYIGYISPANRASWSIKDIIMVEEGRLVFSLSGNTLMGINGTKADILADYFSDNITPSGEVNQFSKFQGSLYGLSQRMSVYLSNSGKYEQWSLAREYLLLSISNGNKDLNFFAKYVYGLGELKENGSLGSLSIRISPVNSPASLYGKTSNIRDNYYNIISNAWFGLSSEERADLEFYTILTLSAGSNHYSKGFSFAAPITGYYAAHEYIQDKNHEYEWLIYSPFPILNLSTRDMLKINNLALNRIDIITTETKRNYDSWMSGLRSNNQNIYNSAAYYQNTVNDLNAFYIKKGINESISWNEIENALTITKKFTKIQISTLMNCWNQMQGKYNEKYSTLTDALTGLFYWAKSVEEESRIAFENCWVQNEQQRLVDENNFYKLMDDYIDGNGKMIDLKKAANAAYGVNAAAWKTHFTNLKDLYFNYLFSQNTGQGNNNEINNVAYELSLLSQRAMNTRYNAELLAREIEWEQMRQELSDNYNEWLEIAVMLVERGRTDWATGKVKMEDTYLKWTQLFKEEYNRVNDEWANAYLISLLDKQQWVKSTAETAGQAADNQYLLFMGTEAERLSRLMDTREPLGFHIDIQNANDLLNEVLYYHGISNIYNALNVINNIANISSPLVKRGIGGTSMWNVSLVKLNASDTIKQANKVIADNEAVKLAYDASFTASQIINSIYEHVGNANKEFRESMDDHFILNGFWKRSGNNYVKDVVIGSTLTKPIITKTQTITGYKNYAVGQLSFKTKTDREYLQNLDSLAIINLIENLYTEVEQIVKDIFGIGDNSIIISKEGINKKIITSYINDQYEFKYLDEIVKLDEREQAPGKFGAHIGYQPAVKPSKYIGQTRDTIFYDEGEGELGRLISDYIYWAVIEGRGLSELTLPFWEKRIWDDTGIFFKSTTIREQAQIGATVAAIIAAPYTGGASVGATVAGFAAVAAISSSADFFFNTLNAGFGYKTWDEALFDSAKTYVTNFASTAISQGTGKITTKALETSTGAASNIFIRTSMAGASASSSTIATSILSGINYNHTGGWSYSNDAVNTGMNKLFSNTLTSMASAFVSSGLEMINTGWNGDKVTNFNIQNIKNLGKFNNLIGDLAGQGVNYVLGNDFTLNLLNMSLLSNGTINSGLLELHLSHDNFPTMNIGTGGANISIDNLYHVFNGALVWNENIQNDIFKMRTKIDINAAFRGVYGFGDKEARKLIKDLRSGKEAIEVNNDGGYFAETVNSDRKLKLILGRYTAGMTPEEQMYLAAILQHEAYRDGLKEGDIDKNGHYITFEDNFNELKTASIARIEMAERINAEYKWFIYNNDGFQYEQILLNYAKETGDYSLYNDYLQYMFNNENDYFFQFASTKGDYQSNYRGIPLINSAEETRIINEQRLKKGFEKYKKDMFENYETEESLWDTYISDSTIQIKYGGNPIAVETISLLGCMFMSTKYGIEALTGKKVDTLQLNNYIKENRLFAGNSNLSNDLMAKIMTRYTNGAYNVSLVLSQTEPMSVETLYGFSQSDDMYLAHLRIKTGENWDHSVMLSGIEFIKDEYGQVTGISAIQVANPANNPNKITGRTTYTMDQIARWDIFKVTSAKSLDYIKK
ncbi:MAG: hypothetical protein LBB81_07620 [Treponema sp.]|nr:hypothetical protein [Treponema sp.]